MKDACPKCGSQFGWRGPRQETRLTRWDIKVLVFSYCPACSVELQQVSPLAQRIASFVGNSGLLVGSGGSLWRQATLSEVPSKEFLLLAYAICVTGLIVYLVLAYTRQHYVLVDSAQQSAAADRLASASLRQDGG
jgi:heme exporter protein D